MHTGALASIAKALAGGGINVVRFNFPYAEAGRRIPDPQPRLEACYRAVADHVRNRAMRLFLGGRSMGGRIASHIVADGYSANGLVFLSYPLHPPGKPDRIRDAHLAKIQLPMLFIQGSKDPFAQPHLLEKSIHNLKTATLHIVENGDHGLNVKGRSPEEVTKELVDVVVEWVEAIDEPNSTF